MDMIELAIKNMRYSIRNLTDKERYVNTRSVPVPSVTEIIHKMRHQDALMYWANSLGMKGVRYGSFMKEASTIGTNAHYAIEQYIKYKTKDNSNIPFLGFMMWYNALINGGNKIEIIGSEVRMCCLQYGGTCDLLIKINGKLYIVDFKTSNNVSSNYFLQLGGYQDLVQKELGLVVDGGFIILQLNKQEPGFDEYILVMDIPEQAMFIEKCRLGFLSLLYAYYKITEVDNLFHRQFDTLGGKTV